MKEWRDLHASCKSLQHNVSATRSLLESVDELEEYMGQLQNMAHEVYIQYNIRSCSYVSACTSHYPE